MQRNLIKAASGLASILQVSHLEITLMQSTASRTLFVGKKGDQEKQSSIYPENICHCLVINEDLICLLLFEN